MTDDSIDELSDATFESQVLKSDAPSILAFGSPWSGPSKRLRKTFAELGAEFEDVQTAWINVDINPQVAGNYSVKSVPTVLLFEDGKVVERRTGAIAEDSLRELFEQAL
ncbi:MAG: thioredoxin family protein [Myxococcota bacterium]